MNITIQLRTKNAHYIFGRLVEITHKGFHLIVCIFNIFTIPIAVNSNEDYVINQDAFNPFSTSLVFRIFRDNGFYPIIHVTAICYTKG